MATVLSAQIAKILAGRNLNPSDWGGKVRVIEWEFPSLPAGNIGDVLVLGRIRANERFLMGESIHTAAGAGNFDVGTYEIAADGLLGAVHDQDLIAAGLLGTAVIKEFLGEADVLTALGGRFVAPRDLYLCITNIGTAFTTAARFSGYALVVGD